MTPSKTKRLPAEELIMYALLIIVGVIPLTNALRAGGPIGVEATLGILMIGLGTIGVIAFAWRWRHGDTGAQPRSDSGAGSRNR